VSRRAAFGGIVVAGLAVVATTGLGRAWWALRAPYSGWQGERVVVDLPRGMDAGSMLAALREAGVIRSERLAKAWLVARGGGDRLRAGEYEFDHPLSTFEVVAKLTRGEVLLHPVTVPEGFDLEEVAARIAAAGFGQPEELVEAFRSAEIVRDLDPEATDLEGYLFPDTYLLPRGEPPARIAEALVGRFKDLAGPDYAERAAAAGLTVREAVTLASLIERETSVPEERRRISRVFHNRLLGGMRLQCDPTVLYALKRAGRPVGRLTYADLDIESPWNTYRVVGLPPGPICNPGLESLNAAVEPERGNDLYFVASPTGGHRFSSDLESHLEAVRDWRRHQRASR